MLTNPFAEEIPTARKLTAEVPPSKHAAGRQPKMRPSAKRRRTRSLRTRISDYLNEKAVREAVSGSRT